MSVEHRKYTLNIKSKLYIEFKCVTLSPLSRGVFARWLKCVCQLELLFFSAAYASMGCLSFWMELGRTNWQLYTHTGTHNVYIYLYIQTCERARAATCHLASTSPEQNRTHAEMLADGLSDSLFSWLKWTDLKLWGKGEQSKQENMRHSEHLRVDGFQISG